MRTLALCFTGAETLPRPRAKIKRDAQLNFSLTRDELTRLRARADEAGMRVLDFGRLLLLTEQDGSVREILALDRIRINSQMTRMELRRIGNNLNQLTRRLNTLDEPAPEALEPLLREIRTIVSREFRE